MRLSRLAVFALVVSLAGCAPPNLHGTVGLPTSAPDTQFLFDAHTHVDLVVSWACVDDAHVVATNTCGVVCARRWTLHRVACGNLVLPYDNVPAAERQALPRGHGW